MSVTQEEINAQAQNVGMTFVWHECNVPDGDAAKAFYCDALGWTTESMPMGEMGDYTMFCNNGMPVAGIMPTVGEMAHVPPHWSTYISVDDVDARASKIASLGGTIVVPAFDVPTIGRMCLCQDPQGAHFWIYKSERA